MDLTGGARWRGHIVWDSAASYARLVRLANLFTAPPDVIAGAAVATVVVGAVDPMAVAGLAIASTALYAAGTTLNDYFDAPVDAVERPERPIPSGGVPRSAALRLGGGLLVLGVLIAGWAAGLPGASVAIFIALAVVGYDGLLKGSRIGFLAMGTTRGLNVLLGASAAGALLTAVPLRAFVPAAAVGGYIAAVTAMAERETEGDNRNAIALALVAAVAAVILVVSYTWWVRPGSFVVGLSALISGAFLYWTGRALWRAYRQPVPATVGPAVGTCVLGLVVLDGALAAVGGVDTALAALVFLIPAVGLSRAFDVT